MSKYFPIFALFLAFSPVANAAQPQVLGEFDDWTAYHYKDASGDVCYIASSPKKDEGKYTKRGDIYAVVTHRPKDNSFDVVNFTAGYTYKTGAEVVIKIGDSIFKDFFTSDDKAWAINDKADKDVVSAMLKGSRMIVQGVSNKGSETKDTYSLAGFSKAYKAISSKCNKK